MVYSRNFVAVTLTFYALIFVLFISPALYFSLVAVVRFPSNKMLLSTYICYSAPLLSHLLMAIFTDMYVCLFVCLLCFFHLSSSCVSLTVNIPFTLIQPLQMYIDGINDPSIAAVNAASLALMLSRQPWNGPIGCVRIGLIDGVLKVDPTVEDMKTR